MTKAIGTNLDTICEDKDMVREMIHERSRCEYCAYKGNGMCRHLACTKGMNLWLDTPIENAIDKE